jgi:hypothetical protein
MDDECVMNKTTKMTVFLLYTIMALIVNASLAKILYISIQSGQWLDKLLHWQYRLQQWDIEGKEFLAKAGGYCELCFSHAVTVLGFTFYTFFMNTVVGVWVSEGQEDVCAALAVNIIWYFAYVSVGTNLSLYFIIKLFQK